MMEQLWFNYLAQLNDLKNVLHQQQRMIIEKPSIIFSLTLIFRLATMRFLINVIHLAVIQLIFKIYSCIQINYDGQINEVLLQLYQSLLHLKIHLISDTHTTSNIISLIISNDDIVDCHLLKIIYYMLDWFMHLQLISGNMMKNIFCMIK